MKTRFLLLVLSVSGFAGCKPPSRIPNDGTTASSNSIGTGDSENVRSCFLKGGFDVFARVQDARENTLPTGKTSEGDYVSNIVLTGRDRNGNVLMVGDYPTSGGGGPKVLFYEACNLNGLDRKLAQPIRPPEKPKSVEQSCVDGDGHVDSDCARRHSGTGSSPDGSSL